MRTKRIKATEFYRQHDGERVRVVWNPKSNLWIVYKIESDVAVYAISRLELHTVVVCSELRPEFAPHGSPGFVGTVPTHSVLTKAAKPLYVHPYAPSKLFVSMSEDNPIEFKNARRVLLDGFKIYHK